MKATIVRVIFFTLLLLEFPFKCVPKDTMRFGEKLADDNGTLVSAGKRFVLGFFGSRGRYLGIWYYGNTSLDIQSSVVWVANRDNPIPGQNGVLQIASDGNLKLLDQPYLTTYFSTIGLESSNSSYILKLLDSGNLAFIDADSGRYLWQSFEHPTDTFLPGMKMDDKMNLTSWISQDDPGTGNYTFQQDASKYFIVKQTDPQWKKGLQKHLGMFLLPIELPNSVLALLSNFSTTPVPSLSNFSRSPNLPPSKIHENKTTAQLFNQPQKFNSASNYSQALSLFSTTKLFMNSSGEIQFYVSVDWHAWLLLWSESYDPCSVYNPCGNFGICNNEMGQKTCKCLTGFEPKSIDNWNSGEFSSGCERKTPCSKNTNDTFLNLKFTKVGINYTTYYQLSNENECKEECLRNCECQAYSFSEQNGMRRRSDNAVPNCFIWVTDINNIHTDDQSIDSISIRVAVSNIELTRRDCETCGKYIVPYPLSNGANCGDPSYRGFFCDKSRDQLQFHILNSTYDVVNIDKEKMIFVIQGSVENADSNCGARNVAAIQLNQSSPFQVINCNDSSEGDYYRMEISWKPPSEPLCNLSSDCLVWPNSTCDASAKGLRRCLCFPNHQWDGVALKCTPEVVASSKLKRKLIISITVVVSFLLLASVFSYFFFRRIILANRQGSRESIPGKPMPSLDDTEMQTQDLVIEDNEVIDVPFFSFESIKTATDNFSDANKLGQGGFGPVYKGVFPGGKEIAVKRLSSHSGQGIQEFQNEVRLIAKLQHRNLVRLLGYCIKGSEKLLLYEYMINKSLDTFIFDQGRCLLLDWGKRFEIIMGITRGLLYLHQDSRLRIIHRDLKTSNILLDEDLNPKISDFGLARIVGGKETEASTQKIVGTYGYMSPEYALEGLFSIKSDVFSFGVIILEIISGKRNMGLYEEVLSLLGYAWKLWQETRPMEFIDKNLLESCKSSASEVLKCINIGLLCVQEDAVDRPTMANVLMMLGSETATLPSPNQPAFISRKRTDSSISGSSSSKVDTNSINKMTVTAFEGR